MLNAAQKRIALHTRRHIHLVELKEIVHCEAMQAYTTFHLTSGRRIMVCGPLKSFDTLLKEHGFVRVHRSHVINIEHIDHYNRNDGGQLVMNDNTCVPVSSRNRTELFRLFDRWGDQFAC